MGLFSIPNPVSIFESVINAKLEREAANALMSASYSATISFLWRSGSSKWAQFTGEGKALQDAATVLYLTLSELESKNFLTFTVPKDLLDPDNLSRFQSESNSKEKK